MKKLNAPPNWEPLPDNLYRWVFNHAAEGKPATRIKAFTRELQAAINRYEIDVKRTSDKTVPDFSAKYEWRVRAPGLFDGGPS